LLVNRRAKRLLYVKNTDRCLTKALFKTCPYWVSMIKATFVLVGFLITVAAVVTHVISVSNNIPYVAAAQSPAGPSEGIGTAGNQTMVSNDTSDLVQYSNPNLGFLLEYPSNWQKEESLSFTSPQGGVNNRVPEVITITTEILPTSDFSLDSYSEAALGQVESFPDFKLLNSSSTTLTGLPAHMIIYSFTDEASQTPWQNLQAWTVKDGMAYIITYGGVPEEFESSLPALQSVMDSLKVD
jgi:hypothetical protein